MISKRVLSQVESWENIPLGPIVSGKEKEPKLKLFGLDIFGWGGGLPCEAVGTKKFGMFFEAQGNQTFWQDILGFLAGYPGEPPKSLRKKKFMFKMIPH